MNSPQASFSSTGSIGHSPQFLKKRRSLMSLPLLAAPFLFFMFYSLGGGKGTTNDTTTAATSMGFNPELPKPRPDPKKPVKTKLDLYRQADEDSLRRKAYWQRDPYHDSMAGSKDKLPAPGNTIVPEDPRADELLKKLDQLKKTMQEPAPVSNRITHSFPEDPPVSRYRSPLPSPLADTPETDPQLEKLNTMLDKIIRIQHPGENTSTPVKSAAPSKEELDAEAANSIPAVIDQDQTLVTGATVALQLTEPITLNGISIPAHQRVYGLASLNNDRLQISINSIRHGQAIYPTALQVYDMDGIPGIHIPGTLNREVAKQSADQGISSLNLNSLDPSLAAQATNAGIQTAKTLFSRKVRLIRVSIRAGYQVLLRSTGQGSRIRLAPKARPDSIATSIDSIHNFIPYLHHRTRNEKMELELRGIYLQDNILFFSLSLRNNSPIDYQLDDTRWSIRDRRQWKRTAVQEIPVQPVYASSLTTVLGNAGNELLTGFHPFALPKDKELVLQITEKNGPRKLVLTIGYKEMLNAKKIIP